MFATMEYKLIEYVMHSGINCGSFYHDSQFDVPSDNHVSVT